MADLLREFIIPRLPVETLMNMASASVQFGEMIADPYVKLKHRENFSAKKTMKSLLVRKKYVKAGDYTKVDFWAAEYDPKCKDWRESESFGFSVHLEGVKDLDMLSTSGGLICFVCPSGFYVSNPSMGTMVELPQPSDVLEPEECFNNVGMGYIPEMDEYVFVHLFSRSNDGVKSCEILVLRDGMECYWKIVDAVCEDSVRGFGVYVDKMFYWMNSENTEIVCYDLHKDGFSTQILPHYDFDPTDSYLVELGGNLCLVDTSRDRGDIMDIYMLDLAINEWGLKYAMRNDDLRRGFIKLVVPIDHCGDKILMSANGQGIDHFDTDTFKYKINRKIHHERCRYVKWHWLRIYYESLFILGPRDVPSTNKNVQIRTLDKISVKQDEGVVVWKFRPEEPYVATCLSNDKISDDNAPVEIWHVVLNTNGEVPCIEGESIAIIPGEASPHNRRFYWIASSTLRDNGDAKTVTLCVERVVYTDSAGRTVQGVCSNFLCDLRPGAKVKIAGPTENNLLMPKHAGANIVMFGSGTGVAPFRSFFRKLFFEEKDDYKFKGTAWLFFGGILPLRYKLEFEEMREKFPKNINLFFDEEQSTSAQIMEDHLEKLLVMKNCFMYLCGRKSLSKSMNDIMDHLSEYDPDEDWFELRRKLKKKGRWNEEFF